MIFLLTDGETEMRHECMNLAKEKNDDTIIHTFGVGDDCDRVFVEKVAEAG